MLMLITEMIANEFHEMYISTIEHDKYICKKKGVKREKM